uniref:DUF957 domain-containing protein n=1 Tax=Heterorhabditis bacteriophora TaxID=37862 RepID=A0A1I7WWJ4_HETBA
MPVNTQEEIAYLIWLLFAYNIN